jgi:signal transduction histidine kinase
MIGAVVALATTCLALVIAQCLILRWHDNERDAWRVERAELVNRAIARHAGEVIALDRQAKPTTHEPVDRPVPVGL